jgi:hypothetical protein
MHIERSIDVAAPPETVWRVMTDVERWHEWTESITRVERLGSGPFGGRSAARVEQPGFPRAVWRVTAFDEGTSFAWTSKSVGATTVGLHRVVPDGRGGSTVTLEVRSTGWLVPLARPFVEGKARRFVEMEAQGLKRRCEGGR